MSYFQYGKQSSLSQILSLSHQVMYLFEKEKKRRQLLQNETSLMNAEQFAVSKKSAERRRNKSVRFQGLVVMNVP